MSRATSIRDNSDCAARKLRRELSKPFANCSHYDSKTSNDSKISQQRLKSNGCEGKLRFNQLIKFASDFISFGPSRKIWFETFGPWNWREKISMRKVSICDLSRISSVREFPSLAKELWHTSRSISPLLSVRKYFSAFFISSHERKSEKCLSEARGKFWGEESFLNDLLRRRRGEFPSITARLEVMERIASVEA